MTQALYPQTPRWWRVWLNSRWGRRLQRCVGLAPEIPLPLWQQVKQQHPFLAHLSHKEDERLRELCQDFLASKEFHGAHGLRVTDAMALSVAQQACLPLLHWGPNALDWYSDFVGIVLQPGEVLALRELTDEAGVVHRYHEPLLGEAMHAGPVMLSWPEVNGSSASLRAGHCLVIHEFAHKLDMRGKARHAAPDGCPLLPSGFMGRESRRDAQSLWRSTLSESYQDFCRRVALAERFGAPSPWLDRYGSQSEAEFFAVACEAYFVQPERLATEWPALWQILTAFFQPDRTN